jgi:hypothetical protein
VKLRLLLGGLACGLALIAAPLAAHPLPGSTVTLLPDGDSLTVILTLPLHELDLAMPGGTGLDAAPPDGPLPVAAADRIGAYLDDHLSLLADDGLDLALSLNSATVADATDDHAGTYDRVTVTFSAPVVPGGSVFPLTLGFDAVMHEVRSHQAAVYVQQPGAAPTGLAVIRPDPRTGLVPPLVIPTLP